METQPDGEGGRTHGDMNCGYVVGGRGGGGGLGGRGAVGGSLETQEQIPSVTMAGKYIGVPILPLVRILKICYMITHMQHKVTDSK